MATLQLSMHVSSEQKICPHKNLLAVSKIFLKFLPLYYSCLSNTVCVCVCDYQGGGGVRKTRLCITQDDLTAALKDVKPSVSVKERQKFTEM